MICPPGFAGAAFGTAADGDGRRDPGVRARFSAALGIAAEWAYLHQVHGRRVRRVEAPGPAGDGDAIFTTRPGLPLAIGTADCLPVVLEAPGAAGLAHVGWRGAVAGVVGALRRAMERAGVAPERAAIGPGIGPCCYAVGPEVLARLPGFRSVARLGAESVDLAAAVAAELDGLQVWQAGECTSCGLGFHSYRRDGTRERQVAVAWVP
ncbi:MAG: laccase domain-containing protein [Actinobacteria bacterium]|nr:laccase domain-containing protein [Actinomycetota bacterium]